MYLLPRVRLGNHRKTILQRKDGIYGKYFKQQYEPEVKRKEESRFKGFNLFNKKEIEKATKHINDEINEAAEEFYDDKKNKEKDDDFEL